MPDVRVEDGEHGPALDNGVLRIEVNLNKGTFDVIDLRAARTVLRDAAASVVLRDGPTFSSRGEGLEYAGPSEARDSHGRGLSLTLIRETDEDEPELSLTLTLHEDSPYAIAQTQLHNTTPSTLRVQAFHLLDGATLDVGAPGDALRFYKHGWQSWSPTVVLSCWGEDEPASPPVIGPGTQPPPLPGRFVSDLVTVIVEPHSGYGLVAGFVSAADQFSHLWFDRDSAAVSAASHADGIELAHREVLTSERLYIEPGNASAKALCRYGEALTREMDAIPYNTVTSGWCSWYYYFQGISETEVIANLEHLAANPGALPVEYVQVDDGYQSEIGDWLTPDPQKFPHGMKHIADEIHARGYKAGLWLAPFIAGAKSRLFAEHPDWFVQFSTGGPSIALINWMQPCYALDLTNPEVIDHLGALFRTICHDWDYDYVKIDFIFAGAVDGIRHDPNVTRAQAYRRGLEAIRDAVGERFVLACGNPMGPSIGLADGARIGPDVAPYWYPLARGAARSSLSDPAAVNSIRNTITRFWMHGRLWMNDPDCLLVRETDAALSSDEVRALATVIGLSGGMVLSSDNLPKLSPARQELISLLLPVYGASAVPLDLFQTPDIPRLFELDCGTHRLLGVFNWSDDSSEIEAPLPPGRWHAFELWEREYIGVHEGEVILAVPAHGCRLLRLTPELGRPQIVGSTLHITQGAMEIAAEDWDGEKLRVRLRPVAKPNGELFIWRPAGIQSVSVTDLTSERTLDI